MTAAPASSGSLPEGYVQAPVGRRVSAYLIDALASGFIAALFVQQQDLPGAARHLPGAWSLVPFVIDYLVGMMLGGQTLGMRLLGLRVARMDKPVPIGWWRAIVRTALLLLLVPALIFDRANRGMHDRITDTAVVVA